MKPVKLLKRLAAAAATGLLAFGMVAGTASVAAADGNSPDNSGEVFDNPDGNSGEVFDQPDGNSGEALAGGNSGEVFRFTTSASNSGEVF